MRNLERRIADVCRKAATQVAKGKHAEDRASTSSGCASGSGRGASRARCASAPSMPGVATGLAYTAAGGDVLFIEAARVPGQGQPDAHRPARRRDAGVGAGGALVGALARRGARRSPDDWFDEHDIHIHVPAGAVPKDGPSAGVTMATAIASLVRDEPVADDVGMTGEITLTGQVLPIGGISEKSLAAQRAGLKRVILPRENEPDLDELPPETREALEFIPADTIEDVFAAAFDGAAAPRSRRGPAASSGRPAKATLRRQRRRQREAREQLRAARVGAVARRRQSSWYSLLPREDERDLLASCPAVGDRVRARPAGRRRCSCADDLARRAARRLRADHTVELLAAAAKSAALYGFSSVNASPRRGRHRRRRGGRPVAPCARPSSRRAPRTGTRPPCTVCVVRPTSTHRSLQG